MGYSTIYIEVALSLFPFESLLIRSSVSSTYLLFIILKKELNLC